MTGPANEATAVAGEMGGIPAWHMLCKGSARKCRARGLGLSQGRRYPGVTDSECQSQSKLQTRL